MKYIIKCIVTLRQILGLTSHWQQRKRGGVWADNLAPVGVSSVTTLHGNNEAEKAAMSYRGEPQLRNKRGKNILLLEVH